MQRNPTTTVTQDILNTLSHQNLSRFKRVEHLSLSRTNKDRVITVLSSRRLVRCVLNIVRVQLIFSFVHASGESVTYITNLFLLFLGRLSFIAKHYFCLCVSVCLRIH